MRKYNPDGYIRGGLSPGVPDEPDVGEHHQHEHDRVEGEDGGDTLPVRQQTATLGDLTILRSFVVNHTNYYQEETGCYLKYPFSKTL